MQFLGLKTTEWRDKLEHQLHRIGYKLGELDEVFDDEINVSPLGRGPSFTLQVKYYDYFGWHAYLYPASDECEESPESIADWHLNTSEIYAKSCYDVWIDWIADAVRKASHPT